MTINYAQTIAYKALCDITDAIELWTKLDNRPFPVIMDEALPMVLEELGKMVEARMEDRRREK